jgi:hypothetical protein
MITVIIHHNFSRNNVVESGREKEKELTQVMSSLVVAVFHSPFVIRTCIGPIG